MKLRKEVLIGIVAGLVIGIPQGLRDMPHFSDSVTSEKWAGIAAFGFLVGLLLGMHLMNRADPEAKKYGGFAFFMVGTLAIGVPTIVRHYNGDLLQSINMPAAFFISIGSAMILGGLLSSIASKST